MGGLHTFTAGEVMTASNVMTYLMNQSMMVFASTSARDSAVTAPSEGMVCVITGEDRLYVYDGSAWQRCGHYSSSGRTGGQFRRAANQSISASTLTTITWDTTDFDSDSFHSGSTFTTVAIPTGLGGLYAVQLRVLWASAAGANSANTDNFISISGADTPIGGAADGSTTTQGRWASLPLIIAAGTTVGWKVYQGTGGAVNITAAFDIFRLAI